MNAWILDSIEFEGEEVVFSYCDLGDEFDIDIHSHDIIECPYHAELTEAIEAYLAREVKR